MVRTKEVKVVNAGKRVKVAGGKVRSAIRRTGGTRRADKGAKVFVNVAEKALHRSHGNMEPWVVDLRDEEPQSAALEANRNGFSQAMVWEAEPEWLGESSEAVSETAGGSREPEHDAD